MADCAQRAVGHLIMYTPDGHYNAWGLFLKSVGVSDIDMLDKEDLDSFEGLMITPAYMSADSFMSVFKEYNIWRTIQFIFNEGWGKEELWDSLYENTPYTPAPIDSYTPKSQESEDDGEQLSLF